MSCKDCQTALEAGLQRVYYYRIENGNVAIIGCETHVSIMFDLLHRARVGFAADPETGLQ